MFSRSLDLIPWQDGACGPPSLTLKPAGRWPQENAELQRPIQAGLNI